jgi:hypothetical protein
VGIRKQETVRAVKLVRVTSGWKGPRVLWKQKAKYMFGVSGMKTIAYVFLVSNGKSCPYALTEHHTMNTYWGIGGIAPRILDLGTRWGEQSASRSGRLTPRERAPGSHRIGGWVDPRAGLDAMVRRKIPSTCQDSNLRSSSLLQCYTTNISRLHHKIRVLLGWSNEGRHGQDMWRAQKRWECIQYFGSKIWREETTWKT